MPRVYGGYSAPELRHVLKVACAAAGLDSTDPIILRGHTNAVVQLPNESVVAKIARRGSLLSEVRRTIKLVQWLIDQRFPTVPLHPVDQPVMADGHIVTFWKYLHQPDRPVPAADIAPPLRLLHSLPAPPFPLHQLDNVAAIRASLAATEYLPSSELRFLAERLDHLEIALAGVEFDSKPGVLQGDPQHRNALHYDGKAVLCDWDSSQWGHPEWDLVTMEIHCRRFGYGRQHYQAFANSYGYDVTTWDGYTVLRDLRELRMITTNARKVADAPDTFPEITQRIDGLRSGNFQLEWQIL